MAINLSILRIQRESGSSWHNIVYHELDVDQSFHGMSGHAIECVPGVFIKQRQRGSRNLDKRHHISKCSYKTR